MNHTSGPWEIVKQDASIVVRTESPNKTKYGASRYAAIGGFDRTIPEQFAEAMANARLIAAAPELLETLENLLNEITESNSDYGVFDVAYRQILIMEARHAIAKARGQG